MERKINFASLTTGMLILLVLFVSCKEKKTGNSGVPLQEIGKLEGELNIVAWPGYIERGETDKNFDWVTGFEAETGCKVNVKTAATSDEMVALMNQGGNFDLVTASGDASIRLIRGGRVQEINTSLIPRWEKVDKRLQESAWHYIDDRHWGVPYQWGSNVLAYNEKIVKPAPTSWDLVFKQKQLADGKSNVGRVQAFDGSIYVADAALYLMYHSKELGIKNPYELTRKQFEAALNLLREQRKLVGKYWHDAFVQIDDFINEGVIASSSWPFQVNLLQGNDNAPPIKSVLPQEGATGWADTTMMHVDAENPNCAYEWLDHSVSEKLQGDLAAWFGSVPVNLDACTGNETLSDEGCERNGLDNFERIWFWRTPVADCETQDECVPYHEWVTNYIAVIGGR